jgi:hypothetical protein
MNYLELQNSDLCPRLIQYLNAVEYHNINNIRPPIPLNNQFNITREDQKKIDKIMSKKQNKFIGPKEKENFTNISMKPTVIDHRYNIPVNDPRNNLSNTFLKCSDESCNNYSVIDDFNTSLIGHHLMPTNNLTVQQNMITDYLPNVSLNKKKQNMNNIAEIEQDRFENLFVDVQKHSVYPFEFPRGGVSSRKTQ